MVVNVILVFSLSQILSDEYCQGIVTNEVINIVTDEKNWCDKFSKTVDGCWPPTKKTGLFCRNLQNKLCSV